MCRVLVVLFVSGGLLVASRARAQEANPPAAIPVNRPLLGPHRASGDLDVAEVRIDASRVLESLIVSPDGKTLYTLESGGLLRRIGLPEFREQLRLEVGQKCGWLALSGEGLLVTVTGSQQVWLVDETTFRVKARMDVPEVMQALSAPTLALGLAVDDAPTLYVLDLKTGTRARRWMVADLDDLIRFRRPLVSHDGVYFLASGVGKVFRFRIAERDIDLVEARPLVKVGERPPLVTDGRSVLEMRRDMAGYGPIDVYRVEDLRRPVSVLHVSAPSAIAFDPKGGLTYAAAKGRLTILSSRGFPRKEYDLGEEIPGDDREFRQLVVRPEGRKLLALTDRALYAVEVVGPVPVTTAPRITGASLRGEVFREDDLRVTEIDVDARDVACLGWADDGAAFDVLQRSGTLRRVGLDGFGERMRWDTGGRCTWLSRSAEGLLLTAAEFQEVWVLDPATFRIKSRIALPSVGRVVSSPELSVAFAPAARDPFSRVLTVVDLKAGEVVREYGRADFPERHVEFDTPSVTPDGKFLFIKGFFGELERLEIRGSTLVGSSWEQPEGWNLVGAGRRDRRGWRPRRARGEGGRMETGPGRLQGDRHQRTRGRTRPGRRHEGASLRPGGFDPGVRGRPQVGRLLRAERREPADRPAPGRGQAQGVHAHESPANEAGGDEADPRPPRRRQTAGPDRLGPVLRRADR